MPSRKQEIMYLAKRMADAAKAKAEREARFVGVYHAAFLAGVTTNVMWRLITTHEVVAEYRDKHWYVDRQSVEAWVAARTDAQSALNGDAP